MAISISSRRTSTCLPTLIFIFPARVHSSSSPVKSSIEPAFSDDHMLIDEYGSEYTSTFLPRNPCVSRTINRFVVKIAESRKVAYAATVCSPGAMRFATSCGIGISCRNIQFDRADSFLVSGFLSATLSACHKEASIDAPSPRSLTNRCCHEMKSRIYKTP